MEKRPKPINVKRRSKEITFPEINNKKLKSIKDIFNDGHKYKGNYILMNGIYMEVVDESKITVTAKFDEFNSSISAGRNGIAFYAFGRDELRKTDEIHNGKQVFAYIK